MQNPNYPIKPIKSDEILTKAKTNTQGIQFSSMSSRNQSSWKWSSNQNSNSNINNKLQNSYKIHQKLFQSPGHKISGSNLSPSTHYLQSNFHTQKKSTGGRERLNSQIVIKDLPDNIRLEEFMFKMKVKFVNLLQQIGCSSSQLLRIRQLEDQNEFLNLLIQNLNKLYKKQQKIIKVADENMVQKEYLQKAKEQLKQAYDLQQKIFERHRKLKLQHKFSIEKNAKLENQLNVQKEENYKLAIMNKKCIETIESLKTQLDEKNRTIQQMKSTLQSKLFKFKNLYQQQQTSKNQLKQRFQNVQLELQEYLKIEEQYSNQIQMFKKEVLKWRDRCKWLEQQNNKSQKDSQQLKTLKRQINQLKQSNQQYKNKQLQLLNKIQTLKAQNKHLQTKLSEINYENQRFMEQQKQHIQITIMQWKQKLVDTIQQYQKLLREKDQRNYQL